MSSTSGYGGFLSYIILDILVLASYFLYTLNDMYFIIYKSLNLLHLGWYYLEWTDNMSLNHFLVSNVKNLMF